MTSFMSVCFFARVSLKQIEEKASLGGPGACSPGKFFEILRGVMAFLVLLKQILIKLFAPHSETSPLVMHFVCTFSIHACLL